MRLPLSIIAVAVLLAPVAFVQGAFVQGAFAQDGAKPALTTDPNVQQNQQPEPNPQGIRSPKPAASATQSSELDDALAAVRRAPPDLQGNPTPRPNALASEPGQPTEPTRSTNPSDLSIPENTQGR